MLHVHPYMYAFHSWVESTAVRFLKHAHAALIQSNDGTINTPILCAAVPEATDPIMPGFPTPLAYAPTASHVIRHLSAEALSEEHLTSCTPHPT